MTESLGRFDLRLGCIYQDSECVSYSVVLVNWPIPTESCLASSPRTKLAESTGRTNSPHKRIIEKHQDKLARHWDANPEELLVRVTAPSSR